MKITWLDNHRYNIPEDTAFMVNELDEKQAEIDRLKNELHITREWASKVYNGRELDLEEIDRLTVALREANEARVALRKDLEEASGHIEAAADEITRLRAALHRISLGSQNSGTTKECLGREARAALETPKASAAENTDD